jgi:hypothetical protein
MITASKELGAAFFVLAGLLVSGTGGELYGSKKGIDDESKRR